MGRVEIGPGGAAIRQTLVCGLPVDSATVDDVTRLVIQRCAQPAAANDTPLTIFSCNVDMVVKAAREPAFAATLSSASLLTADGMPIVWLGRALGGDFPERVTGADLLPAISAACAQAGYSVFLLGAAEGVAREAARRLQLEFPALRVAGTLSPPLGFECSEDTLRPVIDAVRAAGPDVLFLALGAPRQERLLESHAAAFGARVALGIGAAIDMAAGHTKRAPIFLQRIGAEWLWRLAREPRRLGRRYLIEDTAFAWLAMQALWGRARDGRQMQKPRAPTS